MGLLSSPALRYPKSLWSYNPLPTGCVLYLPLWSPGLNGPVFKSVDPFGHTCTVTGAVLGAQGRRFDGVDDLIRSSTPPVVDNIFDGGGTIVAWINPDSDGETNAGFVWSKGRILFATTSEAVGKVKMEFTQLFTGDDGIWETTATQVTIGTFEMVTVVYDNGATTNNPTFYIGTTALTVGSGLTETGTPTGTRNDDSANDLLIGGAGTNSFDGLIGEQAWYNRILTAAEVTYYYNQTRGRFQ